MHSGELVNIADFVTKVAAQRPHDSAIVIPSQTNIFGQLKVLNKHYTFAELDQDTSNIAGGLLAAGLKPGDRCALLVKPGFDFFALMYGLFKAGIIPVLIDPGIGLKPLKTCLAQIKPQGFIGIGMAHIARLVAGWARDSIKVNVTVGKRLFWGGTTLQQVRQQGKGNSSFTVATPEKDDNAAILFTSGSTGLPKGVIYTHQILIKQVEMIRDMFDIQPGEVDLPTFPPFALFDPVLGMTAVIIDMDVRNPAGVNPDRVYEAVDEFATTNMFGSPALLNTVSRDAVARNKRAKTLKRVISAGAPALPDTLERMRSWLNQGVEVFTPYGATECMPTCIIGSNEVLATRAATDAGAGICVGKPFAGVDVRIIDVSDQPIDYLSDAKQMDVGQIGEIVVHGPTVTRGYYNNDQATRLAKMKDEQGRLYHRMGDVGCMDEQGRLWFCGRIVHIVDTPAQRLYSVPIEGVFNAHTEVFRSALVRVGAQGSARPVICIELESTANQSSWPRIRAELLALAQQHDQTALLKDFLLHPGFPVDIRHNSKIERSLLGDWATKRLS